MGVSSHEEIITMTGPLLIGVDLGTSAVKAAVHDRDGSCLAYSAREALTESLAPGVFQQSGDDFVHLALETIGRCVEKSGIDASLPSPGTP